ncbi:MAG: NAD-dependent epimerase/dehydratase family protein [Pseudomonadota bacterium]|jgi:nucleoside-diphosphate-sugar epimerase
MRQALVFGGSGQIGRALLARLQAAGWTALAPSRAPQPELPGVRWLRGGFEQTASPAAIDAIFSCGPLDGFARWYAQASVAAPRVIAFGSTSVEAKRHSQDPHERDVAARLHAAESSLFATARVRGADATVLRPTLVYGAGRDATLTRIARLAHRYRAFVLPRGACGLRQPVHVDDLAEAAVRCVDAPASAGRAYATPGGEAVPYREMVARVLAALPSKPRLIELPSPAFALVLGAARLTGRAQGFGDAAVARLREDLVFDAAPAARDFGYAPRAFRPQAGMFGF